LSGCLILSQILFLLLTVFYEQSFGLKKKFVYWAFGSAVEIWL